MLTNFHRFDEITAGLTSGAFTYSLMELVSTLPFKANSITLHGKTINYTYEDSLFTLYVDGKEVLSTNQDTHESVVEAHSILFNIITQKPEWLDKCTPIEQEFYWKLRGRQANHEVDYQRLYNLTKQFYAARKHMVVDRDREIDTYKWFLTELGNAYAVAGSMKYTDILVVYRQAIYFGTLGL